MIRNSSKFPGIRVSDDGIIYGVSGTPLKQVIPVSKNQKWNRSTVVEVQGSVNGKRAHIPVAVAVLTEFDRERRKGEECCHLDGNPWNNHIDNLVWDTPAENKLDSQHHKNHPGTIRPGRKITANNRVGSSGN